MTASRRDFLKTSGGLAAAAAVVQHELLCGALRDLVAVILDDHRERKIDAR